MSEKNLFEPEKIFDGCDWSSRDNVEETLEKYIKETGQLLWYPKSLDKDMPDKDMSDEDMPDKDMSDEDIEKIVKELSEAILEDIEVHDYSLGLWNENVAGNRQDGQSGIYEDKIIEKFIYRTFEDEEMKKKHGIADYTMRYSEKDPNRLEKGIKADRNYLINNVGEKLYRKIYPVFWVEMLNRNRGNRGTMSDEKCLLKPICEREELEQYIFALLLDTRTKAINGCTIFSGVQRAYTAQNKRSKMPVKRYNMRDVKDRLYFVRWKKTWLFDEDKPGNRERPVFENNIVTVREMLEIGGRESIDIPAFIFFLDRLTGWIEFYNFISLEDSIKNGFHIPDMDEKKKKKIQEVWEQNETRLDKLLDIIIKCEDKEELIQYIYEASEYLCLMSDLELELVSNEEWGPDYAAFEDLKDYNHTAFLYVLGKYVKKYETLNDIYHSILGRNFVKSIAKAYDKIKCNKKYERNNSIVESSIWYRKLFEELFINDISKVNKATRIDALNFYDAYITYTE